MQKFLLHNGPVALLQRCQIEIGSIPKMVGYGFFVPSQLDNTGSGFPFLGLIVDEDMVNIGYPLFDFSLDPFADGMGPVQIMNLEDDISSIRW